MRGTEWPASSRRRLGRAGETGRERGATGGEGERGAGGGGREAPEGGGGRCPRRRERRKAAGDGGEVRYNELDEEGTR